MKFFVLVLAAVAAPARCAAANDCVSSRLKPLTDKFLDLNAAVFAGNRVGDAVWFKEVLEAYTGALKTGCAARECDRIASVVEAYFAPGNVAAYTYEQTVEELKAIANDCPATLRGPNKSLGPETATASDATSVHGYL